MRSTWPRARKRPAPACRRCSPTRPSGPRPRDAWPPLPPSRIAGRTAGSCCWISSRCGWPAATDPGERARILEDAATCADTRAGDQKRALAWLCEALPLAGTSARLEHELLRLAAATGDFAGPARAIGETIAAGGAPPLTLAHLHERRGQLLEAHIGDLAAASESYAAALALTPERLEPRRSLLRTLVRLERLARRRPPARRREHVARRARHRAAAALRIAGARGRPDPRRARRAGRRRRRRGARHVRPPRSARARRDVLHRARAGHGCGRGRARTRARGGSAPPPHPAAPRRPAAPPPRSPAGRHADAPGRRAARQPGLLARGGGDRAQARSVTRRSRSICSAGSTRTPATCWRATRARAASWAPPTPPRHAVDEAVRMHVASGTPDAVGVATTLLLDSARLRVPDQRRWGWLRRAAELTEGALDDRGGRDPDLAAAPRAGAPGRDRARGAGAPVRGRGPLRRRRRACGPPSWSAARIRSAGSRCAWRLSVSAGCSNSGATRPTCCAPACANGRGTPPRWAS